ncbi:formate dehydrogenase accessory sulfurtransferase FdhD, partial [Salmonella enterica subsp. enterica serovar Newport]|nr:formate dehydrogenase accessory sulfurtransferase FdhD [Salmonella enterica subsp. enterica serovar Newport]
MTHEVYVTNNILKYGCDGLREEHDQIATEFPLTIYINNEEFATIVCTPDYMKELIIGFLASEGIIRKFSDIEKFHLDDSKGLCHITLTHAIHSIH